MTKYIIGLIGTLILVCVILASLQGQDDQNIKKWAHEHHYTLLKYERQMTTYGSPFYYVNKNDYIYKIYVKDPSGKKITWWMRVNRLFGNDYEKEK